MPSGVDSETMSKTNPSYRKSRVKFRTVLSKVVHFMGSRVPFESLLLLAAPTPDIPLPSSPLSPEHFPLSADSQGLGLTFTPLVFLKQLNAVVAVELDGSPVAVVADQQRALLKAALTVGFGRDSELCDVSGQVLLDCCPLCL